MITSVHAINFPSAPSKPILSVSRYTNIESVIHLLHNKEITLLNPQKWNDKNDAYYLEEYKKAKNLNHLFAACFSTTYETYHHWHVFSHGTSGAIVKFNYKKLEEHLNRQVNMLPPSSQIRYQRIEYRNIKENREQGLNKNDLPFIKRSAFQDESEFRIIYEDSHIDADVLLGKKAPKDNFAISISVSCIEKIILNPWLDADRFRNIKKTLRSIPGCNEIKIGQSRLIENEDWKMLAKKAT